MSQGQGNGSFWNDGQTTAPTAGFLLQSGFLDTDNGLWYKSDPGGNTVSVGKYVNSSGLVVGYQADSSTSILWDSSKLNSPDSTLTNSDTVLNTGVDLGGAAADLKCVKGEVVFWKIQRLSGSSLNPVFSFGKVSSNIWPNAYNTAAISQQVRLNPAVSTDYFTKGFTSPTHLTNSTQLDQLRTDFNNGDEITIYCDRSVSTGRIYIVSNAVTNFDFTWDDSVETEDFMFVFSDGNTGLSIECRMNDTGYSS